jgi:hypothetical protein
LPLPAPNYGLCPILRVVGTWLADSLAEGRRLLFAGRAHCVANGPMPHELIEVQVGDSLGEDDIERLSDQDGRN